MSILAFVDNSRRRRRIGDEPRWRTGTRPTDAPSSFPRHQIQRRRFTRKHRRLVRSKIVHVPMQSCPNGGRAIRAAVDTRRIALATIPIPIPIPRHTGRWRLHARERSNTDSPGAVRRSWRSLTGKRPRLRRLHILLPEITELTRLCLASHAGCGQ
jgi:hypothetical protein